VIKFVVEPKKDADRNYFYVFSEGNINSVSIKLG